MKPHEILEEAAKTNLHKSEEYGDDFEQMGRVLAVLFPNGIYAPTVEPTIYWNRYHLWFMVLLKLIRLSTTDFNHIDSARDIAVYAAMLESISDKGERK